MLPGVIVTPGEHYMTTYSMFQLVSSTALYLGDEANSTTGMDGSSASNRYDGLGVRMDKQ